MQFLFIGCHRTVPFVLRQTERLELTSRGCMLADNSTRVLDGLLYDLKFFSVLCMMFCLSRVSFKIQHALVCIHKRRGLWGKKKLYISLFCLLVRELYTIS